MDPFKKLEEKIEVSFKNKDLLKEAFTHRSYLNENPKTKWSHNERLEFLGDSVLGFVVAENLFRAFPDKGEGELSVYRSILVNAKTLSAVAGELGLEDWLLMPALIKKELLNSRSRDNILADVVEATLGAVYLDKGYEASKLFVERFIMPRLSIGLEAIRETGGKDAKSHVQEIAQREFKITPVYKVLKESGLAHQRSFKVGLYFGAELKAEGKGQSKQEAESMAAEKWLRERLAI